ncbi:MAG TPA: class I SAM-dependent methyltransferase, partial [Ktedonobacteraceae bacterium]
MSATPPNPRQPYPSTYFMQDRSSQDEMTRLAIQDQMLTTGMGGVLPEQPDPTNFRRVLDIGCGTGGWLIEAAKTYPTMSRLIGIDVNNHMLEYAQAQARAEQVDARVEFQAMDALLILNFSQDYFDLVNVRFATSFVRTWEWPKLLTAMQNILRPGGVIRLTEYERITSSSPAAVRLFKMAGDAFYKAGYLFAEGKTGDTFSECTIGVAGDLERLLRQSEVKNVQTRRSIQKPPAGTPGSESFAEDLRLGFRTIAPFARKWGCLPDNYEAL